MSEIVQYGGSGPAEEQEYEMKRKMKRKMIFVLVERRQFTCQWKK